jgi:hypothetical protein
VSFIESIAAVANDPIARAIITKKAQRLLPLTGSRCATTMHLTFHAAKGMDIAPMRLMWRDKKGALHGDVWPGTDTFDKYLRGRGWLQTTSMSELKPGYMLFSQDRTGRKGAPDHVYLFMGWADEAKRIAWIFDNKSVNLSKRNLGEGRATPFDYALYTTS